jgi:hypothetical protein
VRRHKPKMSTVHGSGSKKMLNISSATGVIIKPLILIHRLHRFGSKGTAIPFESSAWRTLSHHVYHADHDPFPTTLRIPNQRVTPLLMSARHLEAVFARARFFRILLYRCCSIARASLGCYRSARPHFEGLRTHAERLSAGTSCSIS